MLLTAGRQRSDSVRSVGSRPEFVTRNQDHPADPPDWVTADCHAGNAIMRLSQSNRPVQHGTPGRRAQGMFNVIPHLLKGAGY